MADQGDEYVYRVQLDTQQAQAAAKQFRAFVERELAAIGAGSASPGSNQMMRRLEADTKQSEARITAALRGELAIRQTAARAASEERIQLARANAARIIQEEQRLTAQTKAELREREQAARRTQAVQAPGGIGGLGSRIAVGVGGYLAAQGVVGLVRGGAEFAEYSVGAERASEAFKLLAGTSTEAAAKLAAVQEASGGAIGQLDAMGIVTRANVLGLADTAQELERVTRFATIAGRVLGTDTAGALDNLATAVSNLSYERLDQMGVSSGAVRDRMEEMGAAANDSAAFLQAVLEVGEETFGSLEGSSLTAASGVELLRVAVQDLKLELTGTGTAFDEFLKDVAIGLGGGANRDIIDQITEKQNLMALQGPGPNIAGIQLGMSEEEMLNQLQLGGQIVQTLERVAAARSHEVEGAAEAEVQMQGLARAYVNQDDLSQRQIDTLNDLVQQWGNFDIAALSAANSVDEASAAMARFIATSAGQRLQFLEQNPTLRGLIQSGAMGTSFASDTQRTARSTALQEGAQERRQAREREQRGIAQAIATGLREERQLQTARDRFYLSGLDTGGQIAELQRRRAGLTPEDEEWYQIGEQLNRLYETQGNLAKSNADKAARDWERATEEMAREFERKVDAIMNIPGLTGVTPVTSEQMLDSRFGAYEDQVDEWRRRAADELITFYREVDKEGRETLIPRKGGQDWADVDPAQIRAMLGLGGEVPGDVVARRLDEAWASGRLFAEPANLPLIDEDALRRQYEQMQQAEAGRANLRQYVIDTLGLSAGDAARVTGTQSPLAAMLSGGQSEDEIMAQLPDLGGTLQAQMKRAMEEGGGYMEAITSGFQKDLDENILKLQPQVDRIGGYINGRLREIVGSDSAIAGAIVENILKMLEEAVE